jgi:hypothetical protein
LLQLLQQVRLLGLGCCRVAWGELRTQLLLLLHACCCPARFVEVCQQQVICVIIV